MQIASWVRKLLQHIWPRAADTNSQCPRNTGQSWETSYTNPLVINFLDTTSREYSIMWNCQGLACSELCGSGDCGNCESIVSTAGTVFSVVLDSNKTQTSLRLQSDPVLCDITSTDLNNQTTFVLGQNNTCRVDSNLADCLQYTDCGSCAQVSTCGWCNGLCISINASAAGKTPTISCPGFISERNKCCPTYTDCQVLIFMIRSDFISRAHQAPLVAVFATMNLKEVATN